LQLIISPDLI